LRESPALNITKQIAELHSGNVIAVEPNIDELPNGLSTFNLSSFNNAKSEADIHLLLVDHKEFKNIVINTEFLIDTKGIW
jgi:UDP-N-acetyl-D-mannosaminuronic acid dehydrogenase